MKGHCTSHYLAEILRDHFFEESSGKLEFRNATDLRIEFVLDRGMLCFAEGPAREDRLDHLLVAQALMTEGEVAAQASDCEDGVTLATRVVLERALAPETLSAAIRPLIATCVKKAFSWTGSTYEFTPGQPGCPFFAADILSTFECIMAGASAMAYFEPLKEVLTRLPGRLSVSRNAVFPFDKLELKPHQGYIISRADGSMCMEEIRLLLPPEHEDESLLFLYSLAVFGIIEFNPPLSPGPFSLREVMHGYYESIEREKRDVATIKEKLERMMTQTAAEMLGVSEGDDLNTVTMAYESARRRFQRSRFAERVREQCRREISLIDGKLSESFMKLQMARLDRPGTHLKHDAGLGALNPEDLMVRREMVKTEAQSAKEQNEKLADRYFQKAREYFQEKDFHNCIQFCQLAIKFCESSAPSWALMAQSMARNPNPRWQKIAEDAFRRACDLDPWNAEYRVALADFYKEQGLEIRARKQYEKALEILPSHPAALAGVKGRRGR